MGFDKRVWQVKPLVSQGETVKASLKLTSPNGDQGFPGKLDVEVIYSLSDQNEFKIEYKAKTDQPTVVNLTNHSYFNLSGAGNNPYGVLDHVVQLNADRILVTDQNSLPTGEIASVAGTPFDFRTPKAILKDIRANNQQLAYGATKPRFLAGEGNAYQALTFGWLVGGVLEKATGQSLDQLMRNYIVEPLQLDGAYFGTPANELDRVARLIIQPKPEKPASTQVEKPKKLQTRKSSLSEKMITWTGQDPQDFQDAMIPKGMKHLSFFSDEGLQAVIPAANGTFTANSLAKIYAMLANQGEWDGHQIIRPEVFKELSTIQSYARDRVMPIPMN